MREREQVVDKAAASTMSCTPVTASYDSLPGQLSSERVKEQNFARRLSSPHGLRVISSAVPHCPSSLPGYPLHSFQELNNPHDLPYHHPHRHLSQSLTGLAIFTQGVWAQVSLADYMLLSSNHYPNASLILLSTGAAITSWGFLGCLGVAANLSCLLSIFGFIQLAVLMWGLAAGLSGLYYREDIAGGFRSGLQKAVEGYGEDEERSDALDGLQRVLKRCGADGWRDWLLSEWAVQDAISLASISDNDTYYVSVPDSCCIWCTGCHNRPLPEGGTSSIANVGIHSHGCFKKVFNLVNDNVFHIAVAVLTLALTQVAGIILSCLPANSLSSQPHRRGH
ncbi:Tetraspanin-7 [Bagarius yarrelli]|uniref:Tetraspanin-7 n=1 Tax=Bagarius yarrelli TaxID=175774 RepID=A0A556VVT7_BAGYA|nr:Tetraspanin-7 [Bagarius yarrelli]